VDAFLERTWHQPASVSFAPKDPFARVQSFCCNKATTHLKSTRASFSNAKNNVIALEVNQEAVQLGEILQV